MYAIYKRQDGSYFFNPNCYFVKYKKGDKTPSLAICIEDNVSLEYAEKFIKENNPIDDQSFLSELFYNA